MQTIKNIKLILVFPNSGKSKEINDNTNKAIIIIIIAIILEKVIFVGRFIIFP